MTNDNPIKILLIEDNAAFARVLTLILEDDTAHIWNIKHAMSFKEGVQCLHEGPVDIVVTDLSVPGIHKHDIIKTLKAVNSTVPIVVLSAYCDKKLIDEILNQGARKFFVKDEILSESFARSIADIINGHPQVSSEAS